MNHLKIELDKDTYQYLKAKFNGDEKAMGDFVNKILTNKLAKARNKKSTTDNNDNLKDYLKSGKSGSRSYGIKGQGW